VVAQDFDGVAVENGDDWAGEVSNGTVKVAGVRVISMYSNSVSFLIITLLGNCFS